MSPCLSGLTQKTPVIVLVVVDPLYSKGMLFIVIDSAIIILVSPPSGLYGL